MHSMRNLGTFDTKPSFSIAFHSLSDRSKLLLFGVFILINIGKCTSEVAIDTHWSRYTNQWHHRFWYSKPTMFHHRRYINHPRSAVTHPTCQRSSGSFSVCLYIICCYLISERAVFTFTILRSAAQSKNLFGLLLLRHLR